MRKKAEKLDKLTINCPCCSGKEYANCCGPFLLGERFAETPEQLMRSRYTAFTQAKIDYIAATMKGPAAEEFELRESEHWARTVRWLRLDVHGSQLLSPTEGTVSFTAYFHTSSSLQSLHENSLFHKINGRWYYVDRI